MPEGYITVRVHCRGGTAEERVARVCELIRQGIIDLDKFTYIDESDFRPNGMASPHMPAKALRYLKRGWRIRRASVQSDKLSEANLYLGGMVILMPTQMSVCI